MTLMRELKSYGWTKDAVKEELKKEYPTKNMVIIGNDAYFPGDLSQKVPIRIYDETQKLIDESANMYTSIKEIEQYIEEKIGYFP